MHVLVPVSIKIQFIPILVTIMNEFKQHIQVASPTVLSAIVSLARVSDL
jgi:putative effector of murein hydrolase LrgA (UPF0299 family)